MTKQEWRDSIEDFGDLISFCNRNGYEEYTEDYYDDSAYDRMVDDDISDRDGVSWWDLRDYLACLPASRYGGFFYRAGWLDYTELSARDLDSKVSELADALEADGFFDEEPGETEGRSDPIAESAWWQDFVDEPDPEPEIDKLDMGSFLRLCSAAAAGVSA